MEEVGSRLNLANTVIDRESIEKRLEDIIKEKEQAAELEDYETAAHLRYQEINVKKQLEKVNEEQKKDVSMDVSVADIELIVKEKTGIPVTKLQADEQKQMKDRKSVV